MDLALSTFRVQLGSSRFPSRRAKLSLPYSITPSTVSPERIQCVNNVKSLSAINDHELDTDLDGALGLWPRNRFLNRVLDLWFIHHTKPASDDFDLDLPEHFPLLASQFCRLRPMEPFSAPNG